MPIDPYYNPWAKVGQSITGAVGQAMMSQPNPMEQELMRAKLASEQAQAQKYNIDAQMGQAQYNAPSDMARAIGAIMADAPQPVQGPVQPGAAPLGDRMMPVTPEVMQQRYQQNMPQIMENEMRYSAKSPGNMGDVFAAITANAGAAPQQVKAARMGADHTNVDGGYTLGPGNIRFDENGQQVASAPFKPAGSAGSFSTTLPDGTTIEYGGATAPTMNNIQKNQIAIAKFRGIVQKTREMAKRDPTNFGLPGYTKGVIQDVTALANGVAQTMGYNDIRSAQKGLQQDIIKSGGDPSLFTGIFDPNLPALETLAHLLTYSGASALGGQDGQAVGKNDIERFEKMFGKPTGWLTSQEAFLSKLDTIDEVTGMYENVNDTAAGGNVTGNASGQVDDRAAKLKRLQELRALKAQQGNNVTR